MREKWVDMPGRKKAVAIINIIIGISVIVLAMLYFWNIYSKALYVAVPLLGVSNLCNAYMNWKNSKTTAYFCIGTAVFVFIFSIVVFCMR